MSRSRLIELFIKKHSAGLSIQEKEELSMLRFQQPAYYEHLKSIANNDGLLEQIKLVDKNTALNRSLQNLPSAKSRILTPLLKIAGILVIILMGAVVYWYTPIEEKVIIAKVKKPTGIIQNNAQLITNDQVYDLNKVKNRAIDGKDFTLVKNENNHLSYKKLADTTIFHTVKTAITNQYSVVLSDGSKIHVNSNSKVRYPLTFATNKREIYVEGEVYCEIEKAKIPFIVHTSNNQKIAVLGTKFNVRDYQNEGYTEITLVEGSVKVNDEQNTCLLKPNQQVTITDRFNIKEVDSKYYSSWTKPIIRFHNMKLQRVINSFEQLYGVTFTFDDNKLKERIIAGGIIKSQTIDTNLKALSESCNLDIIKEVNNYRIKESLSN